LRTFKRGLKEKSLFWRENLFLGEEGLKVFQRPGAICICPGGIIKNLPGGDFRQKKEAPGYYADKKQFSCRGGKSWDGLKSGKVGGGGSGTVEAVPIRYENSKRVSFRERKGGCKKRIQTSTK